MNPYLNRRQLLAEEVVNSITSKPIMELGADLAVDQATLDLVPVLGVAHSFLKPIRVITKPVLLIPFTRQHLTRTLVGNDESEDGEAENEYNQQEHDN